MQKQPNFLILMVDQLTGTFWEDGPASFLQVPHLRALHERSVNFCNAYSPSPLCTPARGSFMSGMLPSRSTVYDNAAEFPSSLPTFAHYLRRAGYYTALSGKMHFVGADQLHGFEDRLTTDIYPADFGWTPDWRVPYERVDWWYHNLSSVTEAGVALTSNQLEYDDEVVYHARRTLLNIARRRDDRPFCLTASFTHPHDPYTARPQYWDLYEEIDIPDPATASLGEGERDPHSQRIFDAVDANRFHVTPEHVRNARRAYCANISYLDENIGTLLNTLDETGLSDDTIILFVSDHGDMLGERGLWYKMNFFEGAARIPLSISAPGKFTPRSVKMPATAMDVLPTLLELAGVASSDIVMQPDGQSLVAAALGNEDPERIVAAEYMAEGSVASLIMLRQGPWKYIYCKSDPVQLFNLEDDPRELHNLATQPEHAQTVRYFTEVREARWNLDELDKQVSDNQQRRIVCYEGLRRGRFTPWDHQPVMDASERFMRNHLDLNEVEAGNRVAVSVADGSTSGSSSRPSSRLSKRPSSRPMNGGSH